MIRDATNKDVLIHAKLTNEQQDVLEA